MRLTTRGWTVVTIAFITAGFTLGLLTADWCWYGRCGL
jgi:hypothetical protein